MVETCRSVSSQPDRPWQRAGQWLASRASIVMRCTWTLESFQAGCTGTTSVIGVVSSGNIHHSSKETHLQFWDLLWLMESCTWSGCLINSRKGAKLEVSWLNHPSCSACSKASRMLQMGKWLGCVTWGVEPQQSSHLGSYMG